MDNIETRKIPELCDELKPFALLGRIGLPDRRWTYKAVNNVASVGYTLRKIPKRIISKCYRYRSFDGEKIAVTIYEPEESADQELPALVYFHGGGFVFRDFSIAHKCPIRYAKEANCRVFFVHYRLVPDVAFPTPVLDCYRALAWVYKYAKELKINRDKIAVGGDSAGGNLAGAVALMARDKAKIKLCFQMLLYPVTDIAQDSYSMRTYQNPPMWSPKSNKVMWQRYLRDGDFGMLQYASLMDAKDLSGMPPAYVETEEYDCLHDEGVNYAERLKSAGNEVTLNDVKGTFHAFENIQGLKITESVVAERVRLLKHYLHDLEA